MARRRVTEDDVRAIISTDPNISLVPFIDTAAQLVKYVSSKDTGGLLDSSALRNIELWLAAHFYAHRDQLYKSKSTDRASATFQGQTKLRLESTQYGQTALVLDVTGTLDSLNKGGKTKVGSRWLGTDYDTVY